MEICVVYFLKNYYESCCYKHSCTILYEHVFNSLGYLHKKGIVESHDNSKILI